MTEVKTMLFLGDEEMPYMNGGGRLTIYFEAEKLIINISGTEIEFETKEILQILKNAKETTEINKGNISKEAPRVNSPTAVNRGDLHQKICEELTGMYRKKNADYGNSFSLSRKEFTFAPLLTIFNKYNRLKTLMLDTTYKPQVNESIEDTLMDLANYCIMELIEREIDKKETDK